MDNRKPCQTYPRSLSPPRPGTTPRPFDARSGPSGWHRLTITDTGVYASAGRSATDLRNRGLQVRILPGVLSFPGSDAPRDHKRRKMDNTLCWPPLTRMVLSRNANDQGNTVADHQESGPSTGRLSSRLTDESPNTWPRAFTVLLSGPVNESGFVTPTTHYSQDQHVVAFYVEVDDVRKSFKPTRS
jgi:hypothetical protein